MQLSLKLLRQVSKHHADIRSSNNICLSFSGCGFLGAYNFGAAYCLLNESKDFIPRVSRYAGTSAGSLVAAMMLLQPNKIGAAIETLYDMADEVHSLRFGALTPGYYVQERLTKHLHNFLPLDVTKAKDRLFVSVTDVKSLENILISDFDDRDHLVQVLLASCYIPYYSMGYSGSAPLVNDNPCMDGGYSNNLPTFNECVNVTCSPFSSGADICPNDVPAQYLPDWQFTIGGQSFKMNTMNIARGARALFPPTRLTLKQYYDMGYTDAKTFLCKYDFIK